MKNFFRKLGSGDGASSSPTPTPSRKGTGGGGAVHHPVPEQRQPQPPSVVSSWLDSVPTRPAPPTPPTPAEAVEGSASASPGGEERRQSQSGARRPQQPQQEEGMERRQSQSREEDEAERERRRSREEDAVEERVIRESSEADERRREREKEEDDLEEFQLQLVLEMSARDNPEEMEIEVAKQMSLGFCRPAGSPAEVLAARYWNFSALGYDDIISDGFYDLYVTGNGPASINMPSLSDLRAQPLSHDSVNWEAVLVHRGEDPELMKLEQKALLTALELRQRTSELVGNVLIHELANLVAKHMGGIIFDPENMSVKYQNMIRSLRTHTESVVVPLGQLKTGLARHRALLFKVLADSLDVPCRLLKGIQYTGSDDGALNIVKFDDGREFIVDLMTDPGTIIPSDGAVLSTEFEDSSFSDNRQMDREVNTKHDTLERMLLDGSAEPIDLPLSLLEDITNCFSDDRRIGIGGFAVVYKGMVGNGMVAVKKLSRTFDMQENKFHKEIECLMKAKHKNIVRFLGYCSDTQGKIAEYEGKFVMADVRNWLLCFEYVPNGSLDKYIADASHGLTWKERYQIIKGICDGLCYLHEKRILHLDLKPANILVDDHMVPKITDFGISRCLDAEETRVITSHLYGSQGYLAPEFYSGQITFASDIYSLGVIILEILTGKKGYSEDENVVESWMNRLGQSDEGEMQLKQVRVCTKIGIECMDLDPKKRPVVRDIVDMLDKVASPDCLHETAIHISSDDLDASSLREQ